MFQMNETNKDLVKIITLWLKEQNIHSFKRPQKNKKLSSCTQVIFNCSDVLLLAPQALYYSQLFQALRKCQDRQRLGDPLCAITKRQTGLTTAQLAQQPQYYDPEDLMHDIMQGMLLPTPQATHFANA